MTYISQKKLKELKKELEQKKIVVRQKIAERIQEAKALGDLSENADYAEAKEQQAFNEGRIMKLKNLINNAIMVPQQRIGNIVQVGSKVIVKDMDGKKKEFAITGSEETDPGKGKISNESPLGQAFMNSKIDDFIQVQTPGGRIKYKIIKIK